jgi:hypothetical protein
LLVCQSTLPAASNFISCLKKEPIPVLVSLRHLLSRDRGDGGYPLVRAKHRLRTAQPLGPLGNNSPFGSRPPCDDRVGRPPLRNYQIPILGRRNRAVLGGFDFVISGRAGDRRQAGIGFLGDRFNRRGPAEPAAGLPSCFPRQLHSTTTQVISLSYTASHLPYKGRRDSPPRPSPG